MASKEGALAADGGALVTEMACLHKYNANDANVDANFANNLLLLVAFA